MSDRYPLIDCTVAVALALALAGCGGDNGSGNRSEPAAAANARPDPRAALATTIGLDAGGAVTLQSACSDKVLDISGASVQPGAQAIVWTSNGGSNQKFKVVATDNGYVKLVALHSGLPVQVSGARQDDGAPMEQAADTNAAQQQWRPIATADGYEFEPRHVAGRRLDVQWAGTAEGTPVHLWTANGTCAQRWRVVASEPAMPPPAVTAGTKPKKLLELGWDMPCARFIRDNSSAMQQRPFDGVAFKLSCQTRDPHPVGVPVLFDAQRWTEADMQLNVLSAIQWGKLSDNFLMLWSSVGGTTPAWLDDGRWDTIVANMTLYARAAKTARAKGFVLDTEPYGPKVWRYDASQFAGMSFTEVEAQVRRRGGQFMNALQSELPEVRLMMLFGPSIIRAQYEAGGRDLQSIDYALLRAFIDGMLDAINPGAQLIDGHEGAYYHEETQQFYSANQYIRDAGFLFDANNRAKYAAQLKVGHGLYMDGVLRGTLGEPAPDDYRRRWWEHNVYRALATADEYVWLYSEEMDWWQDVVPPTGVIPGGAEGIAAAVQKFDRGEALGFEMIGGGDSFGGGPSVLATSPSIRLGGPAHKQSLPPGSSVALQATVAGQAPGAIVRFYVDAVEVGSSSNAPFTLTVSSITAGPHTLAARLFDASSSEPVATSNAIIITVGP